MNDDRLTTRLDRIFSGLAPTLPEDDEDRRPIGDQFLSQDEALWDLVQKRRDAIAQKQAADREAAEIFESLEEAALASGLPWQQLQDRLTGISADSRSFADEAFEPLGGESLSADQTADHLEQQSKRFMRDGDAEGAARQQHFADQYRAIAREHDGGEE